MVKGIGCRLWRVLGMAVRKEMKGTFWKLF